MATKKKRIELKFKINLWRIAILGLLVLFMAPFFRVLFQTRIDESKLELSQALEDIKDGQVEMVEVETERLALTYKDGSEKVSTKEASVSFPELLERSGIDPAGVDYTVSDQTISRAIAEVVGIVLPLIVVDFLKNPTKYTKIGARTPKGVLLFGPAGVGKTLLARAVAGETGVPFFSMAGSEVMEMLVGVGASRVRDLFSTAKAQSPSIIFIDEVDAIGRQRGRGLVGGHDEREQTLNQILVEMDGFTPNDNVVVIAATNRGDLLDPALLRPGRFDRRVVLDMPDKEGRLAILYIHAKNKKFAKGVNWGQVADRTVGFSGADLENMLNEAAIGAARNNAH